jgi:hypothetical protein
MNNRLKRIVTCAIITAGIAVCAPASAEQYASAQLAISDVGNYGFGRGFDNGLTLVGTYGITIPELHKYFGVEGEISKSIVEPEYDRFNENAKFDYYTAAGYVVFSIPVHERINIRARGGLLYNHYKITLCDIGFCDSFSDSDINPSIGAGANFKFNSNINFMAEVTAIDIDEESFHLSAGAQFKF